MFSFKYPPEAEQRIRDECARTREQLPDDLANKPKLFLGLALYLNAWHELDGERDRNELEPIRRSLVFSYADDWELSDAQRDDLWYYVRRMDAEFRPYWSKKLPKKT